MYLNLYTACLTVLVLNQKNSMNNSFTLSSSLLKVSVWLFNVFHILGVSQRDFIFILFFFTSIYLNQVVNYNHQATNNTPFIPNIYEMYL